LFLIHNQKYYYVNSLNKLYEVFVCARKPAGSLSCYEQYGLQVHGITMKQMQFANCGALLLIFYKLYILTANVCS